MQCLEASLASSGQLIVLAVIPEGIWHQHEPSYFMCHHECPSGPSLAARILVTDGLGSVCFEPASTQNFGTSDCEPKPQLHRTAFIGYSNDGSNPCRLGHCGPLPVDDRTWGRLKATYR
jgi:hypothetical protein